MNILIIDHEPFTTNKKAHYFMDEFLSDHIEVTFWSVCHALPYNSNIKFHKMEKEENVQYIQSYYELLEKLRKIDPDTIVFLEVWFTWSTLELFRILKTRKIRFIQIDYYLNLVEVFSQYSKKEKFINEFSLKNTLRWGLNLLNTKSLSFVSNRYQLNRKSLLFLTGNAIQHFYPGSPKKSISYFDVESFKKIKDRPRLISEKYIVFLDILLPTHPDLQRMKATTLPADRYYQKLRSFFNDIEKDTGYQVVIANHPKANYSDEFGKRTNLSGKTAELVKDSEFVITHGSLSINFAVLAEKPLVYIYTDEFINSKNYLAVLYQSMKNAANYFNSPLINIDSYQEKQIAALQIDTKRYQDYLKKYVYSAEYPLSNYEIIKKSLLGLEKKLIYAE